MVNFTYKSIGPSAEVNIWSINANKLPAPGAEPPVAAAISFVQYCVASRDDDGHQVTFAGRTSMTSAPLGREFRDRSAIVGVGHSRLGKVPGVSSLDLLVEAMKNAIDDAGIDVSDIDGIVSRGPHSIYTHHQQIGCASRRQCTLFDHARQRRSGTNPRRHQGGDERPRLPRCVRRWLKVVSWFRFQKTVIPETNLRIESIYPAAIFRGLFACVRYLTYLTLSLAGGLVQAGVALMKKKWTWSDFVDRSPWGLPTLLWAHTTIVAVVLIVAVYPSGGLFGWLGTHLSWQNSAVDQPTHQDLAKAGDVGR